MDQTSYRSLQTLGTLSVKDVETLRELDIRTLGDLLAFAPFRYARLVLAAEQGTMNPADIVPFIKDQYVDNLPIELLQLPPTAIRGVGSATEGILAKLNLRTIFALAIFAPFDEAESLIDRSPAEDTDPDAPHCVLPQCRKYTRSIKRFASFFREKTVRGLSVMPAQSAAPAQLLPSNLDSLFRVSSDQSVLHLGYTVSYIQEWIALGIHLGEPLGSVNLLMGQDSQVSFLDWRRVDRTLRSEKTSLSERLFNSLYHNRALDETARATAEEHQFGATGTFGANAATAGSFVAAGAVIGGVGGGISGLLTGLALDTMVAGTDAGLGTLTLSAAGTAIGAAAGSAAGSLIFSGATTLGLVATDASGDRSAVGSSAQNIQESTVQNASSLRSVWSTIVTQSVQEEQQTIRTERVTNHNRIHALNAMYFEVLNEYHVTIRPREIVPLIFVPFQPLLFNIDVLQNYWWMIRTFLADQKLVGTLDGHFSTLSTGQSVTVPNDLPAAESMMAMVTVRVNVDEDWFDGLLKDPFIYAAVADATNNGLAGAGLIASLIADNFLPDPDAMVVSLVTSEGDVELSVESVPSSNPSKFGTYVTDKAVEIHMISGVKIVNTNDDSILGDKFNLLHFDSVRVSLKIDGVSDLATVVPGIGKLQDEEKLTSKKFDIASNDERTIAWGVASKLSELFKGIDLLRSDQEKSEADAESASLLVNRLVGLLNANRFAITRLILQSSEREQLQAVLERVEVGGIALSSLAGTLPLGFCDNYVVLPLRVAAISSQAWIGNEFDRVEFRVLLSTYSGIDKKSPALIDYYAKLLAYVGNVLEKTAGSSEKYVDSDQRLLAIIAGLKSNLDAVFKIVPKPTGTAGSVIGIDTSSVPGTPSVTLPATGSTTIPASSSTPGPDAIPIWLKLRVNFAIMRLQTMLGIPTSSSASMTQVLGYHDDLMHGVEGRLGNIVVRDMISLPSGAVFMEPVLSNSKGAELYDMQRNSHYDIFQAPGISPADPNVVRFQKQDLTPTVPGAVLVQQNPPQYPIPDSLRAALGEAGKLDLSTLIGANSTSLTNTVSSLSEIATELAKASAQLTGDAQRQALSAVSSIAQQIGQLVGRSMQSVQSSTTADSPQPPQSQQEKAEVVRELRRIDESEASESSKREAKKSLGAAPEQKSSTQLYKVSIVFLDEEGRPYQSGSFRLTMTFLDTDDVVAINGGVDLPLGAGVYNLKDYFGFRRIGSKAILQVDATFGSVAIPGILTYTLPDSPEIVFQCAMKTRTGRVRAKSVKDAIQKFAESVGVALEVSELLRVFLHDDVNLPFRAAKVGASSGVESEIDIKQEMSASSSSSSSASISDSTETEYEVRIPLDGWDIEIS